MKSIYLIKDLAKVSGCSTHTLKFYLRLGILKEIGRSQETNFRYFDDSSYKRLEEIRELQKKKLSLKEIYQKLIEDGVYLDQTVDSVRKDFEKANKILEISISST